MQISKILFLISCAYLSSLCGPAYAQGQNEESTRGKELADSLCSVCHEVDKRPSTAAKTEIPSFVSIANRQGQTQEKVIGSLIFPHPEMPKVSFTNKDLKDLSAYIMSLKYSK